jgi:hypothetical protein
VRFEALKAIESTITLFRDARSIVKKTRILLSKEPNDFIFMTEMETVNSSENIGTYLPD